MVRSHKWKRQLRRPSLNFFTNFGRQISKKSDERKKHIKTKSKISAYIARSAAVAVLFSCAIVGFTSAFNLPGRWSGVPSQSALPLSLVNRAPQTKTLTFADRVAYQRAIEEVYWRHRTCPTIPAP